MSEDKKIIIDKNFLRKILTKNENFFTSICKLIDNSIQANKNKDICIVDIYIDNNYIIIRDNSGGIDPITASGEILNVGNIFDNNNLKGVGLKQAIFTLGNYARIHSNRSDFSCVIKLDLRNWNTYDMSYDLNEVNYLPEKTSGTIIEIKNLEEDILKEISARNFITNLVKNLGKTYKYKIISNKLKLTLNNHNINPGKTEGLLIASKKFVVNNPKAKFSMDVNLYEAFKEHSSGLDLYINEYLIFNRRNDKTVKWTYLKEIKHSFKNCIAEVIVKGDDELFNNVDLILNYVIQAIKNNKKYFISKKISLQYEEDIDKVERLKEYYDLKTGKDVGAKGFELLYNKYLEEIK